MQEWLSANLVVVLGFLLALSEVLALIPGLKANSIFQLVVGFIKSLLPKKSE